MAISHRRLPVLSLRPAETCPVSRTWVSSAKPTHPCEPVFPCVLSPALMSFMNMCASPPQADLGGGRAQALGASVSPDPGLQKPSEGSGCQR